MQIVTDAYTQENPDNGNYNIIDTAISYDRTGQKRGHRSNFGAAAVLDLQVSFFIIITSYVYIQELYKLSACCKCFEENNNGPL